MRSTPMRSPSNTGPSESEEPETAAPAPDERTWRNRSEHLQHALEEAPTGMVALDRSGCIAFVNARVERMLGYDRAQLVGKPATFLIAEQSLPAYADFAKGKGEARPTTRADGERPGRSSRSRPGPKPDRRGARSLQLLVRRRDGGEVSVELSIHRLRAGAEEMVMHSIIDMSETAAAHREERTLDGQLRALDQDLIRRTREHGDELVTPVRQQDPLRL